MNDKMERLTKRIRTDQMELALSPTPSEVCWMCHLSSECTKCCNKCKEEICRGSEQICGLKKDLSDQTCRLSTWIYHCKTNPYTKEVKKRLII